MNLSLLTKNAEPSTEKCFFNYRTAIIDYLTGRGHTVGIQCKPATQEYLSGFDHAIGFLYPHILEREEFLAPKWGTSNIHPSHLPYGRGACPNVWAIVEKTTTGATWHWMNEHVDAGNIIATRPRRVLPTETGEDVYWKSLDDCVGMFQVCWPAFEQSLLSGLVPYGVNNPWEKFKNHKMKDLAELDDLEAGFGKSTAIRFVDILRARTFKGHEAAYIRDNSGRKIYVRVSLEYAEEPAG